MKLSEWQENVMQEGAHTLAVENIATNAFPNGHSEVDVEPNARDSNTCVILIRGSEIGVVMVVMGVSGMVSLLASRGGSHFERRQCDRRTKTFSARTVRGRRQQHATLCRKLKEARSRERGLKGVRHKPSQRGTARWKMQPWTAAARTHQASALPEVIWGLSSASQALQQSLAQRETESVVFLTFPSRTQSELERVSPASSPPVEAFG